MKSKQVSNSEVTKLQWNSIMIEMFYSQLNSSKSTRKVISFNISFLNLTQKDQEVVLQ